MANEVQVSVSLTFAKGSVGSVVLASGVKNVTVAGAAYQRGIQTVGFSASEVLDLGDAGVGGYIALHNCSATNFVVVRDGDAGAAVVKLLAGEWALFRICAAVPHVQADTAAVDLEYFLIAA